MGNQGNQTGLDGGSRQNLPISGSLSGNGNGNSNNSGNDLGGGMPGNIAAGIRISTLINNN